MTTRFWLFTDCVAYLCRWVLLGLPLGYMLNTGSKNPRAENQKRIDKVSRFLEAADTRLELSIARVCRRLTTVATSLTAQKRDSTLKTPLLEASPNGDVTRRASAELSAILGNMSQDPALAPHVGIVVERLFLTMGELVLRFG